MSWIASGRIKEMTENLTRTEKFLLLILADYFNEESYRCDPSVGRLAEEVLMSQRHTVRTLQSLEKKGFIHRCKRALQTNQYDLLCLGVTPCHPLTQLCGEGGDIPRRTNRKGTVTSGEDSSEEESSSSGAREEDDLRISSYQDLYSNLPDFNNPITSPEEFFSAVRKNGSTIPYFHPAMVRQAAELIQHALYPRRLKFPHPKQVAGLADVQAIIRTHPKLLSKSGGILYSHLKACVGEFLSTDGDEEGGELNPDTVLTRLARQPNKLRQVIDLSG